MGQIIASYHYFTYSLGFQASRDYIEVLLKYFKALPIEYS